MSSNEPTTILDHIQSGPIHNQCQSPLFSIFPGEIRYKIFSYALADYQDMTRPYNEKISYRRPNFLAPRKRSVTALLRSCKRVYLETWSLPFKATEYTFFATTRCAERDKHPIEVKAGIDMRYLFDKLRQIHGIRGNDKGAERNIEIDNVRIYCELKLDMYPRRPSLVQIEPEGTLYYYLSEIPHFSPRCFTISIRHTDWYGWQNDSPLRIGTNWLRKCVFPASTRIIRLELETLERKRDQVEWMSNEIRKTWKFKRADGTIMDAVAEEVDVKMTKWSGNSTWKDLGMRCLRDETKPETIDYVIQTVTWTPAANTGMVQSQSEIPSVSTDSDDSGTVLIFPPLAKSGYSAFSTRKDYDILSLTRGDFIRRWTTMIPPGTSAAEVKDMMQKHAELGEEEAQYRKWLTSRTLSPEDLEQFSKFFIPQSSNRMRYTMY